MPPKSDKISFNDFLDNKIFKDISSDLAKLSSDLRQPDKFAQIFCEAAKTQKNIDHVLKDIIVDLLAKNSEAQEAVTSVIEKVDRSYHRAISGKVAWGVWTVILIVLPSIINYFLGTK